MICGFFPKSKKKKKQNEKITKDKIMRDTRTIFEQEEDYEPKRVSNFWNNNYIEYGGKIRYLSMDEPYLTNVIIYLQNSDTWKIQLTIAINFISSKNSEEERVMHSSKDNIKLTSNSDINDVIEKRFSSLCSNDHDGLETSMKESDFIFDLVQLMYYKCHKVNFKRRDSYIDSPDWIKIKKQQ